MLRLKGLRKPLGLSQGASKKIKPEAQQGSVEGIPGWISAENLVKKSISSENGQSMELRQTSI